MTSVPATKQEPKGEATRIFQFTPGSLTLDVGWLDRRVHGHTQHLTACSGNGQGLGDQADEGGELVSLQEGCCRQWLPCWLAQCLQPDLAGFVEEWSSLMFKVVCY